MTDATQEFKSLVYESRTLMLKYNDRVCAIITKSERCTQLPNIDRTKFLVPRALTVAQLMYVIRRRIRLGSEKALFLYARCNVMLRATACMSEVYEEFKSADGFLRLTFAGENVFGSARR